MPKGPQGQRRPAGVIGGAAKLMRVATSEETKDAPVDDGKDPATRAMGKKGGAARATSLTAEQRQEVSRKGGGEKVGRALRRQPYRTTRS